VIWRTGVQLGIVVLAAGALAPLATSVLVLVTLLGALPIYIQVARRPYAGQGPSRCWRTCSLAGPASSSR
jgi:hypothetical protein